jgi:SagB-type dehydrogenase family enzyme
MKSNIFFENSFFAIKLSYKNDHEMYWHLIRKINSIPGANGELMEILAPTLQYSQNSYYFFDLLDYDLSVEIVSLGGTRVGYLGTDGSDELQIDGWGETFSASVIKYSQLTKHMNVHKNLFQITEPNHSLRCDSLYFVESFFRRDRIYWGLTFDQNTIRANYSTSKIKKINNKTSNWNEILTNRHSAEKFNEELIHKDDLDELFNTSLFNSDSNNSIYASAGGIKCLATYIITRNVSGLSNGIYKINPCSKTIENIMEFNNFEIVNNFLFLSNDLSNAPVYIFYSFLHDELFEKYGHRSTRLGLLTIGGAIQQLHLAATALGLNYRTIGGFDEVQCSKLLGLYDNQFLTCAGILGK